MRLYFCSGDELRLHAGIAGMVEMLFRSRQALEHVSADSRLSNPCHAFVKLRVNCGAHSSLKSFMWRTVLLLCFNLNCGSVVTPEYSN